MSRLNGLVILLLYQRLGLLRGHTGLESANVVRHHLLQNFDLRDRNREILPCVRLGKVTAIVFDVRNLGSVHLVEPLCRDPCSSRGVNFIQQCSMDSLGQLGAQLFATRCEDREVGD